MSKSIRLGILIGAALEGGFGRALGSAQTRLGALGSEIKSLGAQRALIERFEQDRAALDNARLALGKNSKELGRLKLALRKDPANEGLAKALFATQQRGERLSAVVEKQRAALGQTRQALNQAGLSADSLGNGYARLGRRMEETRARFERLDARMSRKSAAAERLRALRGQMLGVTGAVYSVGRMMRAHGDVLQAQGTIASLGIDTEGIEAITRVGKEFSNTWAGTTVADFVRASYDVKSGISSLGDAAVGEFTRIAALTATATKSTTGEMTNLFAKGYGIYRDQFDAFGARTVAGWKSLSDEERDIEFGKYFSAGISASVQAFRTDGAQMSQALSSLGASATTAGVAFAEQLSVLGALQRTMSGSEAATKFQSFLANASKAGDSLGLDFIDEQTGMLLSVPEILDQINDAYGGVIDQAAKDELRKAFGDKQAIELVDVLMSQRDALRSGAQDIERSLSGGLDTTEAMAKAMQQGRGFERLGQQIGNLGATIGKMFYPAAERVANVIGAVTLRVERLAERFPWLVRMIGGAAVALGVAVAALAAATAATWLWNAALLANPIGLVVAGIGAAAALIIHFWDPIKDFFKGLWSWLKNIFSEGVGYLSKVWEASPLGLMFKAGQKLAGFGGKVLGKIFGDPEGPAAGALAVAGGGAMSASAMEIPEPRGGGSYAATVNAPITIHTHPGMDERAVAEEVDRKLRQRESAAAARARGALHD